MSSKSSRVTFTKVADVPPPPKSSSPNTPSSGRPSSEFTAFNDAIASETRRGAIPLRTKPTWVRKPLRSAWILLGFQYAGTAMEISEEARVRTGGQHHRVQGLHYQEVRIMADPSAGHQRYRVADALHKAASSAHSGLSQVRILLGHTDFRCTVRIKG